SINVMPRLEGLWVVAFWKRKTFGTNRGIVLVVLDDTNTDPGQFARDNRRRLGKVLGYFPLFYELGLQIVVGGRDILQHSVRLNDYVDQVNTQWVVLQSIHVVDTAAGPILSHLPDALNPEEKMKPAIQRFFESVPSVSKLLGAQVGFDPMK